MFSSSLSSFKIAQASQPLRVQMYDPDSLKSKSTVKSKRRLQSRKVHRDPLKKALSAITIDPEQAVSPTGNNCVPGPGTAVQSALLLNLKSFGTPESREANLSVKATDMSGLTDWHPTNLDHATAHVAEMEKHGQASQNNQLCHESEPVIASKKPVRAQESCCAEDPSIDQSVIIDQSTTSSELKVIEKRPRSPSVEIPCLSESKSCEPEESPEGDGQSIKRRKISNSSRLEIVCKELRSRPVSPAKSDLTNDQSDASESEAEDIPPLHPCIINECGCDYSTHVICSRRSCASVSPVSFDSKDSDRFANSSIPQPCCDNDDDNDIQKTGSEAREEAETDRFEVKRILDHRERGRRTIYRVKWKGYSEPTWEPADHLDDCAAALDKYWKTIPISGNTVARLQGPPIL